MKIKDWLFGKKEADLIAFAGPKPKEGAELVVGFFRCERCGWLLHETLRACYWCGCRDSIASGLEVCPRVPVLCRVLRPVSWVVGWIRLGLFMAGIRRYAWVSAWDVLGWERPKEANNGA